jgi:hypothetical protein
MDGPEGPFPHRVLRMRGALESHATLTFGLQCGSWTDLEHSGHIHRRTWEMVPVARKRSILR